MAADFTNVGRDVRKCHAAFKMDLQEKFVGNEHCERAKVASITGMALDVVDGHSKTLRNATSLVDLLQSYNLMRCVGKTPSQIMNIYLKFFAGCIVGTLVLYVFIPGDWFSKCKICKKKNECVDATGDKCRPWIPKLIFAFVPSLIVASIVYYIYIFSLKSRVYGTLGLVSNTLVRNMT